ncbi:hypothetical protein ACJA3J_18180 [Halobacillus sp. SY10]|uniref:hypothetical protein n=1 Tax=Halobacillus sp. SY10 TaxID=3381356 RepID=UPI003879F7BE
MENANDDRHFSYPNLYMSLAEKTFERLGKSSYYILTIKRFLVNKRQGPYQYQVIVLEKDQEIANVVIESEDKKQLLTKSKKTGIALLFKRRPKVKIEDVLMVHYKQDRKKSTPWEKESLKNLCKVYNEVLEEKEY